MSELVIERPTSAQAQFHARYKESMARIRAAAKVPLEPRVNLALPARKPEVEEKLETAFSALEFVQTLPTTRPCDLERRASILRTKVRMEREEQKLRQIEELKSQIRFSFGMQHSKFDRIARRICTALRITKHDLMSMRRSRELVFARQAIVYWACRRTTLSLPQIGKRLDRDHTTILHGKRAYPVKRQKMGRYLRPIL